MAGKDGCQAYLKKNRGWVTCFVITVLHLVVAGVVVYFIVLANAPPNMTIKSVQVESVKPESPSTVLHLQLFAGEGDEVSDYYTEGLLTQDNFMEAIKGVTGKTLYIQIAPNRGCASNVIVVFEDDRQLLVLVSNQDHGKGILINLVTGVYTPAGFTFHDAVEAGPNASNCNIPPTNQPTRKPTQRPTDGGFFFFPGSVSTP